MSFATGVHAKESAEKCGFLTSYNKLILHRYDSEIWRLLGRGLKYEVLVAYEQGCLQEDDMVELG